MSSSCGWIGLRCSDRFLELVPCLNLGEMFETVRGNFLHQSGCDDHERELSSGAVTKNRLLSAPDSL